VRITRTADVRSTPVPGDWVTGTAYMEPVAAPPAPSRVSAAAMRFAPGARTVWHTHPLGQTIVVTAGVGLCQRRGGPVQAVGVGDAIRFAPGEDHWHGAAPNRFASYVDMQEADDSGSPVTWGDHVTGDEYRAPRAS
jgi:quercetin dioxygenase-like cupin family protein